MEGHGWFNSAGNTQLRPQLLQLSKGKEWADVETLKWETGGERRAIRFRLTSFTGIGISYTRKSVLSLPLTSPKSSLPCTYFLCHMTKQAKCLQKGHNIFRPASLPPSLRIHNPHSTPNLPPAYHPPYASPPHQHVPRLKPIDPLHRHRRPLGLLPGLRGEHRLRRVELGGSRRDHRVSPREPRCGQGDCQEAASPDHRYRVSQPCG